MHASWPLDLLRLHTLTGELWDFVVIFTDVYSSKVRLCIADHADSS